MGERIVGEISSPEHFLAREISDDKERPNVFKIPVISDHIKDKEPEKIDPNYISNRWSSDKVFSQEPQDVKSRSEYDEAIEHGVKLERELFGKLDAIESNLEAAEKKLHSLAGDSELTKELKTDIAALRQAYAKISAEIRSMDYGHA